MSMLPWLLALAPLALEDPAPSPVGYALSLQLEPALTLEIRAGLPGDADGETVLSVNAGWGGVQAAGVDLEVREVRDAAGQALAFERRSDSSWSVRHAPAARLEVRYALRANEHQAAADPGVHYLPILNEHGCHLIGELTLLAPEGLDDALPRDVRLEFHDFEAAGWELASSFGRGSETRELTLPLFEVRQALIVAGEFEYFEYALTGGRLLVAVAGENWGFDREEFAQLAHRVVALERDFFEDPSRDFHLVSLLPVGQRTPGSISQGGTALHRAFAAFALPGSTLGGAGRPSMAELLLHEMFHDWNGHALRRVAPSERLFWFSEGFTSFYTRRLALRGGWIDVAQYADDLGRVLREYATNPARDAGAERITAEFWTDENVQKLPYQLGDLIAARVDGAIRRRSEGARSLDDFLRALVREARAAPTGVLDIETEDLLRRLESWSDADTIAALRASALEGAPFELPSDLFAPVLALEPCTFAGGEPGQSVRLLDADPTLSAEIL